MYFKTEGIILSRYNFGEADRILRIYTKDYGKVIAIVKGVRRPRSRKAGHLEIGNWCKLFIAKGKNIDLVTEVELKKAFGINEFTAAKANKIYHLLEIVESLTEEKQKNPGVFILLVQFLKKIAAGENFNLVSIVFKVKLLSILGFFGARNLRDSKAKNIFEVIENDDFEIIKRKINLKESSYLKLLQFLDSMIEKLTLKKLKTVRFLDGQ